MRKLAPLALILAVTFAACSTEEPPRDVPDVGAEGDAAAEDTAAEEAGELSLEAGETIDAGEADTEQTEPDAEPAVQAALPPAQSAAAESPLAPYREGVHYERLTPTQPTSTTPDKIEVAEVFWYGCPSCYSFEPYVSHYLQSKPANVEFVRIPSTLNRSWHVHARAYFTAEVLGVLEQVHAPLFREIHVNNNPLNSEDSLADFFADHGVDEEEFRKTFRSFAVETRLRRADSLGRRYRLRGVPTVVVNGKYLSGNVSAGGYDELLNVIEFLVAKESAR